MKKTVFGVFYGKAEIVGKEFLGLPKDFTGILDSFKFSTQTSDTYGIFIKTGYNWPSGFGFFFSYSAVYLNTTGTLTRNAEISEDHEEYLSDLISGAKCKL